MQARYSVVMVEFHPERGFVIRKMLVAKFVAKGDAIAYAIQRRDNQPKTGVQFHWYVETPNSAYGGNIFKAEPEPAVVS
jgi:hypothetical protein